MQTIFDQHMEVYTTLSRSESVSVTQEVTSPQGYVAVDVCPHCKLYFKLEGVVDVSAEQKRLTKKCQKLEQQFENLAKQIEDSLKKDDQVKLHTLEDKVWMKNYLFRS